MLTGSLLPAVAVGGFLSGLSSVAVGASSPSTRGIPGPISPLPCPSLVGEAGHVCDPDREALARPGGVVLDALHWGLRVRGHCIVDRPV